MMQTVNSRNKFQLMSGLIHVFCTQVDSSSKASMYLLSNLLHV
jgi:hypothetical protein